MYVNKSLKEENCDNWENCRTKVWPPYNMFNIQYSHDSQTELVSG